MHSVFSWEYWGDHPSDIEAEIQTVFEGRKRTRHLHNVVTISVESGTDFLELNQKLQEIADAHDGDFFYAFYALSRGSMYRGQKPPFGEAPPAIAGEDGDGAVGAAAEFWATENSDVEIMGERAVEST